MDQSDQRGHRSIAFDKMEGLVREMQNPQTGVPVRSQKQFLTSIPSAFTGYDVIEWIMSRFSMDDPAEAVNIANQFCHYGYFFPVSDWKNLVVKDDGSLYRFQIPYYWPCQNRSPDNVEYAIYLAKRSLRNKQKHALEDYELEALNSLKKNLANKWDFITIQAEEQVKLSKDRKKGEKTVSDSQERAYWRVHRPPPGYSSSLEPVPLRASGSNCGRKHRTWQDLRKEVDFLKSCIDRTRVKVSVALESLLQYSDTYMEYDPMLTPPLPSNPWITDDVTFWHLNSPIVDSPMEKRVKKWALSIEDLVADPTGLQEFTNYLRKEYSHENIRFWMAANDLRRSSQTQIARKVKQIYEEFLEEGAPCEVNIDGKTMERTQQEMKNPSRFTFDAAAEHVYTLLLKKDCYPRFIRSDQFKNMLAAAAVQPTAKRKFDFFGFGGAQAKGKAPSTVAKGGCSLLAQQNHPSGSGMSAIYSSSKRRGSDRSLTGSTHELSLVGKVLHSHSQTNITDYRESSAFNSEEMMERSPGEDVCPWDYQQETESRRLQPSPSSALDEPTDTAPTASSRKNSALLDSSSSSDVSVSVSISAVSERLRKCALHDTFGRFASRRSSTARTAESARPSVSSTEDLAATTPFRSFDSNPPSCSDKEWKVSTEDMPSTSGCARRRSAIESRKQSVGNRTPTTTSVSNPAPTPLISVSTASEMEPACTDLAATSTDLLEAEELVESKQLDEDKKAEQRESKTDQQTDEAPSTSAVSSNEVCPWEDEENCKVKASNYMKFYETLGYL